MPAVAPRGPRGLRLRRRRDRARRPARRVGRRARRRDGALLARRARRVAFAWRRDGRAVIAAVPALAAAGLALAARFAALGAVVAPSDVAWFLNPLAGSPVATRLANLPAIALLYARNLALPFWLAP